MGRAQGLTTSTPERLYSALYRSSVKRRAERGFNPTNPTIADINSIVVSVLAVFMLYSFDPGVCKRVHYQTTMEICEEKKRIKKKEKSLTVSLFYWKCQNVSERGDELEMITSVCTANMVFIQ